MQSQEWTSGFTVYHIPVPQSNSYKQLQWPREISAMLQVIICKLYILKPSGNMWLPMSLKSQPWSCWYRFGSCSCHSACLHSSPSLCQPAADSDMEPCWSLSRLSTCSGGSCADGDRHFSQLQETAIQSSLDGSITVEYSPGHWDTHRKSILSIQTQDYICCFLYLTIYLNVNV